MIVDSIVATVIAVSAVASAISLYLVPRFRELRSDIRETKEQTVNNHAKAAHPNLRDDLDHKFSEVGQTLTRISDKLTAIEYRQHRTDAELARINDVLLQDRQAATRRLENLEQDMRGR